MGSGLSRSRTSKAPKPKRPTKKSASMDNYEAPGGFRSDINQSAFKPIASVFAKHHASSADLMKHYDMNTIALQNKYRVVFHRLHIEHEYIAAFKRSWDSLMVNVGSKMDKSIIFPDF